MPTPVETTATVTPPAESDDASEASAGSSVQPEAGQPSAVPAAAEALGKAQLRGEHVTVSLNSILGGLAVALVTAMFSVLMWQINSLGNRVDANGVRIEALATELRTEMRAEIGSLRTEMQTEIGSLRTEMQTEIGSLRTEMRAEIGSLRAEMQAGFREINATLLDHTDRLARLEAAAGLPRIIEAPESPGGVGE
ncbi:hypothetical protein [Candidatus Poriferisodalis sp.]|uniref:hypothetical protein n=1 Tax=Candidatus Poriferisodalis sp. TaxID=3101277 RepID=UPI003B027A45